jgi:sec-independent protein translocase protein TatA
MVPILAVITPTTMIVVGIIVLLLFGNRIPQVMRNLGQGITEFKKGMKEIEHADDEPKV